MRFPLDSSLLISPHHEIVSKHQSSNGEGDFLNGYKLVRLDAKLSAGYVLFYERKIIIYLNNCVEIYYDNILGFQLPRSDATPLVACNGMFCGMYELISLLLGDQVVLLPIPLFGGLARHSVIMGRWLESRGLADLTPQEK